MAEISVQVCYASAERQILQDVTVDQDATIRGVIERSGILRKVPGIDLETCRVGVFGKLKALDSTVREQDRVEIYRPLIVDPKESRRKRADKKDKKSPVPP